jgi:pimeloyl-ACP methyl ester carboxylesterase
MATAVLPTCAYSGAAQSADRLPSGLQEGTHEVVINGMRQWYRVAGNSPADSPPVVFLHGAAVQRPHSGSAHFAELAGPKLERSLRMVYYDQRGRGRSKPPPYMEISTHLSVEDIEQLRQALGVPKIALIGHARGGSLALEYAAKYPEHVHRLVFVSGLFDPDWPFHQPQLLTMPVLVIAGRHDRMAQPGHANAGLRAFARRLPNARFIEYEQSGHFVYADEPARFARDVIAFFTAPLGGARR